MKDASGMKYLTPFAITIFVCLYLYAWLKGIEWLENNQPGMPEELLIWFGPIFLGGGIAISASEYFDRK